MYVLVRTDFQDLAQVTVQACHACLEWSKTHTVRDLSAHPHLVLLGVADESQLLAAGTYLSGLGIRFEEFREADMDSQLTALATEPIGKDRRKLFRIFNLFRPPMVGGKVGENSQSA